MKYCAYCGQQLQDADEFCSNCGKKAEVQENQVVTPVTETVKSNANTNANMNESANTVTKNTADSFVSKVLKNKKIVIPAIAALVVIIIGVVVYTQMQKRVNINDFITVKYDGYDTAGTAKCVMDEDAFADAVLKAQGKDVTDLSEYQMEAKLFDDDNLVYALDNTSDLSNGDTINLNIHCAKELEKSLGVKFIYKDKTYTVSDLQQTTEIDPFEGVDVEFNGTSPNTYASVKNNSTNDYVKSLYFKVDKSSGIKKGDKVTVTVSADQKSALKKGYKLTSTTKEYTCDKVDEYLSDISSLTTDQYSKIQTEAKEKIESFFAKNTDTLSYNDLQFAGSYLLNTKSGSSDNRMYAVYSVTVSSKSDKSGHFEPTKVYMPVEFDGVLVKSTGAISYYSYYTISGSTKLTYSYFLSVPGYTDGTEMYSKLVTANKDIYKCQVDGSISDFGK